MIWFIRNRINDINTDELLDIQHKNVSSKVEKYTYEGLSWTINSIIKHQLVISGIALCEGSSCFPFSKELRNPMKRLINIKKEDNECFKDV